MQPCSLICEKKNMAYILTNVHGCSKPFLEHSSNRYVGECGHVLDVFLCCECKYLSTGMWVCALNASSLDIWCWGYKFWVGQSLFFDICTPFHSLTHSNTHTHTHTDTHTHTHTHTLRAESEMWARRVSVSLERGEAINLPRIPSFCPSKYTVRLPALLHMMLKQAVDALSWLCIS